MFARMRSVRVAEGRRTCQAWLALHGAHRTPGVAELAGEAVLSLIMNGAPGLARAREGFLGPAGRKDLVCNISGLATADMGSTTRATKVACISVTASSIEMPMPSLRISRPKSLAAHMAPYSFAPESVTSKGIT